MPDQEHDITYLISRFAGKMATEEELDALFRLLAQEDLQPEAARYLQQDMQRFKADEEEAGYWSAKPAPIVHAPKKVVIRKTWFAYAAACILIAGTALFLYKNSTSSGKEVVHAVDSILIPRLATNRAVLTLADGSVITLDSAGGGIIAHQGSAQIVKLKNGQIMYRPGAVAGAEMLNTMTTPRGGQYQLVLPDGTGVWLNAESSITYPVAFTGTQRLVSVTGEAFFEVVPDSKKPFRVNAGKRASIDVLGTSFNINSYAEEGEIKTTLLEGSIQVSRQRPASGATHTGRPGLVLKPGQQALIPASSLNTGEADRDPEKADNPANDIVLTNVDIAKVMAWKNGLFNFDGADVKTVMNQLMRWYDIRVEYEGTIPELKFEGELSRDLQLSQVLNILERVGVKFRLEGKTLIVGEH